MTYDYGVLANKLLKMYINDNDSSQLISHMRNDDILDWLSLYFQDAKSVKNKSDKKKDIYIKSKQPNILILKAIKAPNLKSCAIFLLSYLSSILSCESNQELKTLIKISSIVELLSENNRNEAIFLFVSYDFFNSDGTGSSLLDSLGENESIFDFNTEELQNRIQIYDNKEKTDLLLAKDLAEYRNQINVLIEQMYNEIHRYENEGIIPSKSLGDQISSLHNRYHELSIKLSNEIGKQEISKKELNFTKSHSILELENINKLLVEEIQLANQDDSKLSLIFEKLKSIRHVGFVGVLDKEQLDHIIQNNELKCSSDIMLRRSIIAGEHIFNKIINSIETKDYIVIKQFRNEVISIFGNVGFAFYDLLIHEELSIENNSFSSRLEGKNELLVNQQMSTFSHDDIINQAEAVNQSATDCPSLVIASDINVEKCIAEIPNTSTQYSLETKEKSSLILTQNTFENDNKFKELFWGSIAHNKLSFSYVIACYNVKHIHDEDVLPPDVVAGLILSKYATTSNVAGNLNLFIKNLTSEGDFVTEILKKNETYRLACGLCLVAMCISPTLLVPNYTNSYTLLNESRKLVNKYPMIVKFIDCVSDHYVKTLNPIKVQVLQNAVTDEEWNKKLSNLTEKAAEKLSIANNMSMSNYEPANRVWRKWLEKDNDLNSVLFEVSKNNVAKKNDIESIIRNWSLRYNVVRYIEAASREIYKTSKVTPIKSSALEQLIKHSAEICELGNEWLSLHNYNPINNNDYDSKQAIEFRKNILSIKEDLYQEIQSNLNSNCSEMIKSAMHVVLRSVEDVYFIIDHASFETNNTDTKYLLNKDMLLFDNIELDDAWDVVSYPDNFIEQLSDNMFTSKTYKFVFSNAVEVGNISLAEKIIQYIRENELLSDLEILERKLYSEKKSWSEKLESECERTLIQIRKNSSFGLLGESERLSYQSSVDQILLHKDYDNNFSKFIAELKSIQEKLINQARMKKDELKNTLGRIESAIDSDDNARIIKLIERGDTYTAQEFIYLLENNKQLPSESNIDVFNSFFPLISREIEDYCKNNINPFTNILKQITGGGDLFGISFSKTLPAHIDSAKKILNNWREIRQQKSATPIQIKEILSAFGFGLNSLENDKKVDQYIFETDIVSHRSICPIPFFGSHAFGKYRLICMFDRQHEDFIINSVGDTIITRPTIIFHFGRISEDVRRKLSYESNIQRKTFIVIDDTLAVFLACQAKERINKLFRCSMPFTYNDPYNSSASLVSPELFFGRKNEIDHIMDTSQPTIIYGGRQLGKTALLREVERRFHSPESGKLIKWIDLKPEQIGTNKPAKELISRCVTNVLRKYIHDFNHLPENTSPNKLKEKIVDWIEADPSRCIILLFDEADNFLSADRNEHFETTDILKDIMITTKYRFKIVFAGLHNVQRFWNDANSPIKHLGDPICIGPLDKHERQEAFDLVRIPFNTLGFFFEDDDLIYKILNYTNYYPSLTQIYCKQFLRRLLSKIDQLCQTNCTPPFMISNSNLDEMHITKNIDLSTELKKRFKMTLDLDQRYEIIALLLAYLYYMDSLKILSGLTSSEIRKEVLHNWADAFLENNTEDSFLAIIEEMVGLGILRRSTDNKFTFRSDNVLHLMGTLEEVESDLFRPRVFEENNVYVDNRRILHNTDFILSPFTYQQENYFEQEQHSIKIVFGNIATGIEYVYKALSQKHNVDLCSECLTFNDMFDRYKLFVENRRSDISIFMIDTTSMWDINWVENSIELIRKLKSKQNYVHIIFLSDPAKTLNLLDLNTNIISDFVNIPSI